MVFDLCEVKAGTIIVAELHVSDPASCVHCNSCDENCHILTNCGKKAENLANTGIQGIGHAYGLIHVTKIVTCCVCEV